MPYCDPINVPFVVSELQRRNPRSVIDVGCGMGGWGPLWDLHDRVHVGDALAFLQSGPRFLKLSSSAPVTGILLQ